MSLEVEETSEKEVGEEKRSVLRKRKRAKGRHPKIQKGKKNMTQTKLFSKNLHDPIFGQHVDSVNTSLSVIWSFFGYNITKLDKVYCA